MIFLKKANTLSVFLFFWVILLFAQFQIPDIPKKQTSIYDDTSVNLLSVAQEKVLEQKLIRYSDSTSTQIVIAIISTTKGEDINFLGAQWGQKWGIGQAKKDNGILVLLAKDDRKIAISTGYGTEGSLTDFMCKKIIEHIILPQFKQGEFYAGLDKGTDAIFKVLNGEFKEERDLNSKKDPSIGILPIVIFFVILIILSNRKRRNDGRKNGGRKRNLDIWDVIILSNMGRSSGSGRGSFGGGSSGGYGGGFGGGGFGGGGASGGW